jgi:biotin carboxyl carrier protein
VTATFQVHDIEELLALMEQWGIAELHINVEEASADLVRTVCVPTSAPVSPHAAAAAPVEGPAREPVLIRAPVVGVFHLVTRGFPHERPRPGDLVQAGQVIGSIELMHVPTDLISPVSGTITSILTEDGTGAEYDQPLLVIQPYEEVSEDEAGMLPPPAR